MHLNQAILTGNLGADPELKYTNSGTPVCNMRMATNHQYKNAAGDQVKQTDWHRIVIFGPNAENCAKHLKKGRLVTVVGRIHTRQYEKDGQKRTVVEVVARQVLFGPRPASQAPSAEPEGAEGAEPGGSFVPPEED